MSHFGGELDDSILRQNLVELLRGGLAHVALEQALDGIDPALRNERPADGLHSVWQELEHMRLAQEDNMRYMLDMPGTPRSGLSHRAHRVHRA